MAKNGMAVRPEDDDDIGATALSANLRPAADDAFRNIAKKGASFVEPDAADRAVSVPATVLQRILAELVPYPEAQAAYQKTYGDKALEAVAQDLMDFESGTVNDPCASVAHLLRKKPSVVVPKPKPTSKARPANASEVLAFLRKRR